MFKRGNILSEYGIWIAMGVIALLITLIIWGIATGRASGIIDKINDVARGLFGFLG